MVKKIRFDISPDGEVSVNVECATGTECERLTQPFEESLGMVSKKEYKDAYFSSSEHEEESLGLKHES
jgi:hypothetical protein